MESFRVLDLVSIVSLFRSLVSIIADVTGNTDVKLCDVPLRQLDGVTSLFLS